RDAVQRSGRPAQLRAPRRHAARQRRKLRTHRRAHLAHRRDDHRRAPRPQRIVRPLSRLVRILRRLIVSICTLFNRPYIDLEPYVDCAQMAALDGEICLALTRVATSYTGGSHKTMGIVPPSLARDPYVDYGQVIAAMTRAEFAEFVALGDEPHAFDL